MIIIVLLVGFGIGERLHYDAKFSFLNLGTMTLEVRDTLTYEDVHCYDISSVLTSARGLRFLFSINDTIEVYTSSDSLFPYMFRERINESGYHRASNLFFDRDSNYVNYDDSLVINTTAETRDILSFWYYLRGIPLELGDTILIDVHNARENHRVRCVVQKRELVKTKAGDYETILVEPQTEGKGIFGAKGGMQIWYSEKDRVPVQIRASMKFGTVLFKLKEVID
ncbi:MAG: DUF3108 domain-containing protein [candidate division WOR-3 bacterium]|nr:DUF3108 domain-containing protein [candidate division WOR-3 bacterium]